MHTWNRREFSTAAVLALLAPKNIFAADDPLSLVDIQLRPALKAIPQLVLTPGLLTIARKTPSWPNLPEPAPQPVERHIPGPAGAPDIHVTIVDPNPGTRNRPVFVHTHGGGMVTPNPALNPLIQSIAQDCHCVVVSIDYRLAPETTYAGSTADNYTALKWVYANAETLGIDRTRIAVGGESAGGGHAALLAQHARDQGEIPLCFQLLMYPMLDDRTGSSRPVPPSIGNFIWNAQCNKFGWTAFLGQPAGSPTAPPGSVPARVENLAGLPPAWIGVGSIDLFVDEDLEYGKRLLDSGVSTEIFVAPGAYHAFNFIVPQAKVSEAFNASWKSALRRAFATA